MYTPFLLGREKSILDKANAKLVALYRSDEAHSFANAIEEKVGAGVDTNSNDNNNNNKFPHHQNNIRSNLMNPNNKRNWNGKSKNFDGESGTTPKTNALGADKNINHQKGQQKQKKAKRTQKKKRAQLKKNNGSAQPYAENKK